MNYISPELNCIITTFLPLKYYSSYALISKSCALGTRLAICEKAKMLGYERDIAEEPYIFLKTLIKSYNCWQSLSLAPIKKDFESMFQLNELSSPLITHPSTQDMESNFLHLSIPYHRFFRVYLEQACGNINKKIN